MKDIDSPTHINGWGCMLAFVISLALWAMLIGAVVLIAKVWLLTHGRGRSTINVWDQQPVEGLPINYRTAAF